MFKTLASFILVCCFAGCAHPPGSCPTCSTTTTSAPASLYVSDWLTPEQRQIRFPQADFTDHRGRRLTSENLRGHPLAISFIYTRCQNPRKCPLVAETMASLSAAPAETQREIALITYDPEYDTPEQLTAFAQRFDAEDRVRFLRPDPQAKEALFRDLNVAVNFNTSGVNLHGLQLLLFDKHGRYVRTYHTLLWDNSKVLADLKRLADE